MKELDILYRDEHVLAVNKAPGLAVHAGTGHTERNLLELLRLHLAEQGLSLEQLAALAPAHRLDLHASGVLLFGLDKGALEALRSAFEARQVRKSYWVLVHGRCYPDGVINRPLPNESGQLCPARTRYKRMGLAGGFSLLLVRTDGGRAHQIRRHFQSIGHPVAGDARYGGELRAARFETRFGVNRMMLHARRLVLEPALFGKRLAIVASPDEGWRSVLDALGLQPSEAQDGREKH
ncbi:MAG: RluA family pseudouridine synthase [Myxococcota bacterium]|jgi:RluA family pseudouridine synthase|nr:RluA family pseudouridine synthase [Myxococcota bacterium]